LSPVNWTGANSGNNQAQQGNFADAAIACYSPGSLATPVLNMKANFVGNDPTRFTVNFSAVDASTRQVIFLSVAETPVSEAIAPLLISQQLGISRQRR
jgi:hypothetical protein